MSHVQLSTASPERIAPRRTLAVHARTGVCRNLFGPVDHDELNREMKCRLREMCERDQIRWNFSFRTDTPLPGQYAWEEASGDSVPPFYRDPAPVGRAVAPVCPVQERLTENRAEELNSGKARRTAATKRRTGRITDYFGKRKRLCETKQSEGAAQVSATTGIIPVEQTPRKRLR